jgi:hypothetical protein
MSSNHNSIYKVHHLIDKERTKAIYVFYGNNLDVTNPEELFKRDPTNSAFIDPSTKLSIFTDLELAKIQDSSNPIDVIFIKQQIHFDDSIATIKLKLIEAISNSFSIEQIYLFCMKTELLNATNIYQTLTQKNRLDLTKIRVDQFFLNVHDETGYSIVSQLPIKDVYTYDDILELNLANKKFTVSKVLGQKFFIIENEYPFVCNPFDVTNYDPFIERAARKSLTTLNSHLLLNNGGIVDNNIYLCLAEDVLLKAKENGIPEDITSTIYYPFLQKHEINSYDELQDKKFSLIDENKKLLTKNTLDTFESIDLFYDVYKYGKESTKYKYKSSGIQFVKFSIRPEFSIKIPLDVIFKIIHATDANPLIKYNPSVKLEKVYRLFADKISTDGRKIPFLTRANIFKLMKEIGKTKSVTVYINSVADASLLTCEFEENGNITISGEFDKIVSVADIDALIKANVNPIIQEVKNYLEQSGYTIQLYESMYNDNVTVKRLNYQSNIEITKPIKINDFIGCITSAFVIETKDIKAKNGINMRFKRVSNFNKFTSQEAFVIEQANQKDGLKGDEIILALIENYRMNEGDARSLLAKLASELQVERGVKRKDIEIKSNPGFKTTIKLNSITSTITINVENINDIFYLETIPIYLDSFIRLTQDKASTLVSTKRITSLCSTEEKVELVIEDIIAPVEEAFPDQEIPIVESDDMDFEDFSEYVKGVEELKEPKVKSAVDLIYGDEDDYEDEEEEPSGHGIRGGQSSSVSGEFIEDMKLPSSSDDDKSPPPPPPPPKKKVTIAAAAPKPKFKIESLEEEETVRDIVGMRLKNPSPFASKMYELDPVLFLKEDKGKFGRYSRVCPSSAMRQPVLITEEEMQEMKNEDYEKVINKYGKEKFESFPKEKQDEIIKAESFLRDGDVIKYGSTPDKKYYYTCPRYWCLKTNRPIDPSEMVDVLDKKTGKMVKRHPKCGGIISEDETEIKNDGNYVYEFFDSAEHGTREKYKKHFPGFLASKKHPDGLCIPCCFSKWNTPGHLGRRKECSERDAEKEEHGKPENVLKKPKSEKQKKEQEEEEEEVIEKDNYVKGPEKFPLDSGRWGYLPVSIQNFFQEASSTCQVSKTNTNIKPNHTCLLRHGVEFSNKQSFIACIADAKYYAETMNIPSIADMKKIIIDAVNIDDYITYQNGNNVEGFSVDDVAVLDKIDVKKYSSSKLYNKIYNSGKPLVPSEDKYFGKVVASFENFIAYLANDSEEIDYTYLWDIICRPNPTIFSKGCNLIIMEIVNNDITNNIELICPTNHYSSEVYNPSRQTLFIVKIDNLYEPIYAYENREKAIKVTKFFSEHSQILSSNMRAIFQKIIKPILREICSPLPSMPTVYKFKHPILLEKLVSVLNSRDYTIEKQILNYQSKVVGVIANKGGVSGYIPCYPAAFDQKIPNFVFMNDDSIYNTYDKTVKFLTMVYKDTKGVVPSNPELKILEDEHVVGVLTETNQFIQISKPIPISSVKDSIPVIKDNNYLVNRNATPIVSAESYISTIDTIDTEREAYIKKIKLETNFYNVFRNTIRILLNDYENIATREIIEKELNASYAIYSTKLHKVIEYLKELVKDTIIFSDNYDYNLINSVSTCITLPGDKCNSKNPVCSFTQGKKCQLIIPKINLLNDKNNNEIIYFGKMADELIRYSRIKTFIFQPQTYLSFGTLGYNLRENEIIVIQSLLTKDYFDGLVPEEINKYVKYNTYDNAEPKISQVYENTFEVNKSLNITVQKEEKGEKDEDSEKEKCSPKEMHISSKVWKDVLPGGFKELYYNDESDINCGFQMAANIIYKYTGTKLNKNKIKIVLDEEYSKYFTTYGSQIIDILISEGKKTQGTRVKAKTLSFQDFIYLDDYFITNLDLWIIMQKYSIPSIIIASKPIIITNRLKNFVVLYGSPEDDFVFIYSPALRQENIPKYSIIVSQDDKIEHFLDIIKNFDVRREIVDSIANNFTLEKMFQTFTKKTTVKAKSKLTGKIVVEESSEEDVPIVSVAPNKEKQSKKQKATVVITKQKTKKLKPKFSVED